MISLKINNFRNIGNREFSGDTITVYGRNGSGKTNLLRAVEWVLFATFNGRKAGINFVRNGQQNCQVVLSDGKQEYTRMNGNTTAYLDSIYRPIMYCSLLDQEAPYIKKILADFLIADKAEKLFGPTWQGSIEASINYVCGEYKKVNDQYVKATARMDFLNEQLETLSEYTEEDLEKMSMKLEGLNEELKKATTESGQDVDTLKTKIDSIAFEMNKINGDLTVEYEKLKYAQAEQERLKQEGISLSQNKCPTCGGEFTSQEQLETKRQEYSDKSVDITKIEQAIESLKIQQSKYIDVHTTLQKEFAELSSKGTNTDIKQKQDDATLLWKNIIQYNEKLKLKDSTEKEINDIAERLIEIQKEPALAIYNEIISPKGELNKLLEKELKSILPGCEFVLFEASAYTDDKSVFKVIVNTEDGPVQYSDLSRSGKAKINIWLSTALIEKCPVKLLLVDDGEMFTEENAKEILFQNPVDKIITYVSDQEITIGKQDTKKKKVVKSKKKT